MRRVAIIAVLALAALTLPAVDAGDPLFITVRETELRSAPGFLSAIVARLEYGDELAYQDGRSGWYAVSLVETGEKGWIHEGSVRENMTSQLVNRNDGSARSVSSREIALAGRGFNRQLEGGYGEKNGLSFESVDELESFRIDSELLAGFLREADLSLPGGDQ